MKKLFSSQLAIVVILALTGALYIVQSAAFIEGLSHGLGVQWYLGILALPLLVWMGVCGVMLMAGVGFYGAVDGWGAAWWQASLLCSAFLILASRNGRRRAWCK